jgi:outer membrane biosynthesis protein TonB
MDNRKVLTASAAILTVALVASWAWFFSSQQRTEAQLAMLIAKPAAGAANGRTAADPYKDEAVKNTLRKHTAEIRKLWLAYLDRKQDKTEGEIETDWQIGSDGEVLEVGIVHSDFTDAALNEGVLTVLKSLRYPPPPGGMRTYIAHKFKFKKVEAGT